MNIVLLLYRICESFDLSCHWMTSRRVTEISQSSFGEQNVCTKLHGNPYPDISVWTKVVILPSREPAQIEVSQYGSPEIG